MKLRSIDAFVVLALSTVVALRQASSVPTSVGDDSSAPVLSDADIDYEDPSTNEVNKKSKSTVAALSLIHI